MARDTLEWLYGDPMGPDGLVTGMYGIVPLPMAKAVQRASSRQVARLHGAGATSNSRPAEVSPVVGVVMGIFAALASE